VIAVGIQLLGSAALLLTVLRHGIFEAGDQRRFLLAYEKEVEYHLRQTTPTLDVGTQIYKDLRSEAHKARDEEKRAGKLSQQVVKEQEAKLRKMSNHMTKTMEQKSEPKLEVICVHIRRCIYI